LPADGELLSSLLQSFSTAFINRLSVVQNLALGTIGILLVIDAIISILMNLENGDQIKNMIIKIIKYGAFIGIVENWGSFSNIVIDSFVKAGAAGGTDSIMKDPSAIVNIGFNLASPIPEYMNTIYAMGWSAVIVNLINLLMFAFCWLFIIIAFAIMGIQVFVTYLEFYIMATLTIIFIPGGVNKHTSFLAEKAFGSIVSFGVKFMVLTFILNVAQGLMQGWVISVNASTTWDQMLFVVVGCWTIALLCWQAPGLAAGLMNGSPSLTGGAVVGGAIATGAGAVGLGMATATAGGLAGSTLRGAASLGGAMAGGTAGKEGALAMAAGAIGGGLSHLGNNIANTTGISGIKDAFSSGFGGGSAQSEGSDVCGNNEKSTSGISVSGNNSGTASDVNAGNSISSKDAGSGGTANNSSGIDDTAGTGRSVGSEGYKPVDNATPPPAPQNKVGSAAGQTAAARATQQQGGGSSNKLNTIAQFVGQTQAVIPPESGPSGGIHVPIKHDD